VAVTVFGEIELDLAAHEIRRSGQRVPVEPQVFDVLAHLVTHRERMVPKTELLDEVWGDRFVSESALTSRIKTARRAVGDNGREQRVIRTVHGRGYRFVAEVVGDPGVSVPPSPGTATGLSEVVVDLARGEGSAVALVGPPGRARSEALDEVYEEALAAGLLAARSSAAALRPFAAIVDALDELVQRRPSVLDEVPEGCRDELVAILGGANPSTPGRFQLSVRELVIADARTAGVMVCFDDLELADSATLGLVGDLARLGRRHRVAVVAAVSDPAMVDPDLAVIRLAPGPRRATDRYVPELAPEVVTVLTRVALGGPQFDLAELRAASGLPRDITDRVLDRALGAGVVEAVADGFRFVDAEDAARLADGLAPHRRAGVRAETARALSDAGGDPSRIAEHLLAAGDVAAAVPYALLAARQAAELHLHDEVLRWVDAVVGQAAGPDRVELLALRGAAMVATGHPGAASAFREALVEADDSWRTPLRAGLAQASILAGDLPGAEEAIAGVSPDGGPFDGAVYLAQGMVAFFRGRLDDAEAAADAARELALAPGAPSRLLDVITLQGMIAHNRGEWFDRLRRELRASRDSPELASTVFDCHLCVAEYLLYGPLPYEEVVGLARDLQASAAASGARRAEAFALCVAGEALLLAGRLEEARVDLEGSIELHRQLRADTGLAHSLQRLAEVELAEGNRAEAERLAREALPLARWSPLARHLVQRTYGTLVAAAPDLPSAVAVVQEAEAAVDESSRCEYCDVMLAVPSAATYAAAGRLEEARAHLDRARHSAALWQGTAWRGAVAEAEAVLAQAEGRSDEAEALLEQAARLFDQAGQPLDAARCREAMENAD
jgi:DNA-binding winged helix-turn-helix (wHTH) protein/tetratricopeptide (TPR) repeat protein